MLLMLAKHGYFIIFFPFWLKAVHVAVSECANKAKWIKT